MTATFAQSGAIAGVNVLPTTVDVEEGGITGVYSVSLSSEPASVVTIIIAPDGQTSVDPTSLTFDATNWDMIQRVAITAVDDTEVEGVHTSIIGHSATSADADYDGITIADVTANVSDNDAAPGPVSVQFDGAAYSVKETAGVATIRVALSAASTVPVTVTYATGDGTATAGNDYASASGTLRFDVGQTSQAFTVPVFGDVALEGDETVQVTLSTPVNAALGAPNQATLTIVDNLLRLPLIATSFRR